MFTTYLIVFKLSVLSLEQLKRIEICTFTEAEVTGSFAHKSTITLVWKLFLLMKSVYQINNFCELAVYLTGGTDGAATGEISVALMLR